MNIRDLRYLLALSDTKHFGRASQQCHVSQPTLSMQIKKLEEELGVMLFERGKRFVKVTPEAQPIIEQARQALDVIDGIKEMANTMKDPLAGRLRLAIFPTLSPYLLPKIIKPIKSALPNLSLQVFEYQTEDCLSRLYSGDLDAILIAHPERDPRLNHRFLFTESFELVCAKGHALSTKKVVQAQAIQHDDLLLLQEGHCLRDQALDFCLSVGTRPQADFSGSSLSTLLAMVGLGEGVTLIPAMATSSIDKRIFTVRPLKQPCPRRSIHLHWRNSSHRDVLVDCLSDIICQAVSGVSGVSLKEIS